MIGCDKTVNASFGGDYLLTSKKKLFLLGWLLFIIMSISGIYSLKEEINEAESGLSTSAVDISLKEYNQNNEEYLENNIQVMPGDEIRLIPRINNLGIDCYIRTKITYTLDQETFDIENYIEGNYKSWIKNGDYYYYKPILEKGKTIDLFNKLIIPELSYNNGEELTLHTVVEAVQAKHFDNNWDEIDVVKSIDRTYDIEYEGSSSIIYDSDVNNYIELDEEFFNNLGNIVPGDIASEEIIIYNNSSINKEFFLEIDYDEINEYEKQLLENIVFKIKNKKGKEIIQSTLGKKKKYSLGVLTSNQKEKFTIELSVPKELNNDYSKLFTRIMWKFSYNNLDSNNSIINPKTWDLKFDLSIIIFILSTIGFLIVLFLEKKNTNNNKIIKKKEVNL